MRTLEGSPVSPRYASGIAIICDDEVERKATFPEREIRYDDLQTLCVCGEEAGETDLACLLVGLGVRELSLSPRRGAAVRHAIRRVDSRRAVELAERAFECRSPSEIRELLTMRLADCSTTFVSPETSPDLSNDCS